MHVFCMLFHYRHVKRETIAQLRHNFLSLTNFVKQFVVFVQWFCKHVIINII